LVTSLLLAITSLLPVAASAQVDFGVRGGFYDDADAGFLGFEVLTRVYDRFYLNPNVEYGFVDDGSLWTLNGDLHYDFAVDIPYAV
jgi:hypothetical protein